MTAVKEQFMQMLPQIQRDISIMPDSDIRQIINIYVNCKPKNESEKQTKDTSMRIGAGKGKFLPDDFDDYNEEIYAEIERYALS